MVKTKVINPAVREGRVAGTQKQKVKRIPQDGSTGRQNTTE
jgi:hypothetical protein